MYICLFSGNRSMWTIQRVDQRKDKDRFRCQHFITLLGNFAQLLHLNILFSYSFIPQTIKQFLPAMERNNRGHIVAISSSAGIMGSPYFTAYGYRWASQFNESLSKYIILKSRAAKHAVVGLMKCLYEEMDVNSQIKLTTICTLGICGTGLDIPTKTRFPFLLPIMTLDYAVDHIFESILKEEELCVLPYTFKWIQRFIR